MSEVAPLRPQLAKIADDLKNGRSVPAVRTREFLSWFDAQRRGYWVVQSIRRELERAALQTVPDFESAYIDAPLDLRRVVPAKSQKKETVTAPTTAASEPSPEGDRNNSAIPLVSKDPTYRISKLPAANQAIVSIRPDSTLAECITILMSRDFSQLPVMTGERDVKGMISWKSIGSRLALSNGCSVARDFMLPHHEIRASASIFDAIPAIIAHEYVLVRGQDNRIVGIITATDLSQQFRLLSEPFLLLSEIENMIRAMIGERFALAELAGARDPGETGRKVEDVHDLNFGEYIRLLGNDDRWKKLNLAVDRHVFCRDLDDIRKIRNNVMHFDPDGIVNDDLSKLRNFTNFLKELQNMEHRKS